MGISYGSITVTDVTDITDVYLQYCMAADTYTTAAAIAAKTTWASPEVNWFTLTTDTTVINNKRYYRLSNGNYYIVTPAGSENPSTNGWYEDSSYPTWQPGYQIWIREVTVKEGIELPEYGTPYLDTAVNQINTNLINLQTKVKKIWSDNTGTHMASGIGNNDVIENDTSTYGFNSWINTSSLNFKYNNISLMEMGLLANNFNGIKLYSPITTNGVISGNHLDTTVAEFSADGIQIGLNNSKHIFIDDDSMDILDGRTVTASFGANSLLARLKRTDTDVFVVKYSGENAYTYVESFSVSSGTTQIELNTEPPLGTEVTVVYEVSFIGFEDNPRNNSFTVDIPDSGIIPGYQTIQDAWSSYAGYNGKQIPAGSMTIDVTFSASNRKNVSISISTNNVSISSCNMTFSWKTTEDTKDEISLTFGDRNQSAYKGLFSSSFGKNLVASGDYSFVEGYSTIASGNQSHAEGYGTIASGNQSHAEGYSAIASGDYSHAEGYSTNAHGDYSHAEGSGTKAFPYGSHAEGSVTTANGVYSHAEGGHTLTGSQSYSTSYGQYAHAEGYYTVAKANYSHAQNYYTTANYEMQTAIGSFNDNQSDTAFEIGNGTGTDARSNALTVDWNGNVKASGNITDGTGNILSAKANSANMFHITNVTPSGYNFDPNQYRSLSSSNITTYSGYTPIIVQARCTNKSGLHVFNYSISNTTLNYEVINRTSSQVNDANFAFRILHIRNELIG